jgi:hypothetical protein
LNYNNLSGIFTFFLQNVSPFRDLCSVPSPNRIALYTKQTETPAEKRSHAPKKIKKNSFFVKNMLEYGVIV